MLSSGSRRGILSLGTGGGFNPLTLFGAGEQGGWWDPSDLSTMFQDSAGATPVTAAGQPVGLIRDKSGRGNNRTQVTAGSRPTLQIDSTGYYLLYDGVDDFMVTGNVDFSAASKMTVVMGARRNTDGSTQTLIELSASFALAGGFALFSFTGAPNSYTFASTGSLTAQAGAVSSVAPVANVLTGQADIANDICLLRSNGVQVNSVATDQGVGNYANATLFFGIRNSATLPFNGREYQTVIRAAASDAGLIQLTERFVASKMGVAVP